MDENGNPTPFDLSVSGSAGDVGAINTGPIDATTLPVHTTSLAGLDGAFADLLEDDSIHLRFSDLNPFYTYEVYVFAYGDDLAQFVSISPLALLSHRRHRMRMIWLSTVIGLFRTFAEVVRRDRHCLGDRYDRYWCDF